MRLDYLFIADRIEEVAGGINIFGVGTNDLLFSALPAAAPPTTIIAGFMIAPGEFDTDHLLAMEVWGPDGGCLVPRTALLIMRRAPHPLDPAAHVRFHACMSITGLLFHQPGAYAFRLFVNGGSVGTLTIHARHAPTPTGSITLPRALAG